MQTWSSSKTRAHTRTYSQNGRCWSLIRFSSSVMVVLSVSLDQTKNPRSVCFILWNVTRMSPRVIKNTKTQPSPTCYQKHKGKAKWVTGGKVSEWIRVLVVILGGRVEAIWVWLMTGWWVVGMPCAIVSWKQLSELPQWLKGCLFYLFFGCFGGVSFGARCPCHQLGDCGKLLSVLDDSPHKKWGLFVWKKKS